MSIDRNTGIFFGDEEVPIVSGKDLTELLPESHVLATYSTTSFIITIKPKMIL